MKHTNEWQTFFDGYALQYNQEVFTQNTEFEIRFLQEELGLPPHSWVFEIGCGTGRHSVGLAQSGYNVTAVDISEKMLAQAKLAAGAAGVKVDFIHSDIMDFIPQHQYDAAICLCEGALCLLASIDDALGRDELIIHKIFQALKPGSKFIVNVLNACRIIRLYNDEQALEGRFDPLTMIENNEMEINTPAGKQTMIMRERAYTPPEFLGMLKRVGFICDHVWGGTAGAWDRQPLKLDEYELMVIAHKP